MKPAARKPERLVRTKFRDLIYLCDRMREDEVQQYMAFSEADRFDPDVAALAFANTPGPQFTLLDADGVPVCAGGWFSVGPGVWQSWMVGTMDGWARHWRDITKSSRWLMDQLLANGARRLQTNALACRTEALEWYEKGLLMVPQGVWKGYGRGGEDVAHFARLKES